MSTSLHFSYYLNCVFGKIFCSPKITICSPKLTILFLENHSCSSKITVPRKSQNRCSPKITKSVPPNSRSPKITEIRFSLSFADMLSIVRPRQTFWWQIMIHAFLMISTVCISDRSSKTGSVLRRDSLLWWIAFDQSVCRLFTKVTFFV